MADIIIDSDSGKFKAGDDLDLEIYNNGSHSYISNATASQSIVLRTRASGGSTADAVTIDADKNVTIEGNLTVNKAITFNETSADADFRVESNNNTHMLFVDANNDRVGIATSSPDYTFEVEADASATWLARLYNTGSTEADNGVLVRTDTAHDGTLTFATHNGTSYTMAVQGDGKIGIGTTSPDTTLHIAHPTTTIDYYENKGLLISESGSADGIVAWSRTDSECYIGMNKDLSSGTGYLGLGMNLDSSSNKKVAIWIRESGNVGIGTASPNDLLEINNSSSTAQVRIMGTGANTSDLLMGGSSHTNASVGIRHLSSGTGTGHLAFLTSASDGALSERMRIDSDGDVYIGATNYDGARFTVYEDANDQLCNFINATNSLSDDIVLIKNTLDTSESSYNFLLCADHDQARMKVRGDGELYADGSSYNSGADYAEYFETKDGEAIDSGITVKLDGDKIVPCGDGDNPIGVIRPEGSSMTIGNTAWSKWDKKYLSDDYGKPIFEECTWTIWYENVEGEEEPKKHAYESDRIPSDVIKPDDAILETHRDDGRKHFRRKLNPDYDPSKSYQSRTERNEWQIVGLLGQIPIKKGQPVADSWIKMKDVSDTVEMYFVK